MSTSMHIKSSESGVIRVFHIDLPGAAIERFTTQAGTGEWPLQYALGAKTLRSSFVEVINIRDLGDMTLSQYLSDAHDVSAAELKGARSQLDALKGFVLVLPSRAFDRTAQDLTVSTPLRWIGTFNEPKPKSGSTALRSESAKGVTGGTGAPQKRGSNGALWVAVSLFVVVALGIILAKFLIN